jgi:phosphoglucomutase
MPISPMADKPVPKEILIDPARVERDYDERRPDLADAGQGVSFGTSGHRGFPPRGTFTGKARAIVAKAPSGAGG